MKLITVLFLIVVCSNPLFGQLDSNITLIPVINQIGPFNIEVEKKTVLFRDENGNEVKRIRLEDKPYFLNTSTNGRNITISDPINFKGDNDEKLLQRIIKLYDRNGLLLAKSEPINLYDEEVHPLGDDNTVLLVFPAGTAPIATIGVLKRKGSVLKKINSFEKKTGLFTWDAAFDGSRYICGCSSWDTTSPNASIHLFNNNGDLLWEKDLVEKYIGDIFISKNNSYLFIMADREEKGMVGYLYTITGNLIAENDIFPHGNYRIAYSDDKESRFFGLSTRNKRVFLFDSKTGKRLFYHEDEENDVRISDLIILDKYVYGVGVILEKDPFTRERKVIKKYLYKFNFDGKYVKQVLTIPGNPRLYERKNNIYLVLDNNGTISLFKCVR